MEGVDKVKQKRIQVAIWAYAYDALSTSLVSDSVYDETARQVNKEKHIKTGHKVLDDFFNREEFNCISGAWVYDHPEFDKVVARATAYVEYLNRRE
jgi:hypothetical protein